MRDNDSEHGQCERNTDYDVIALGDKCPGDFFSRLNGTDNSSKQLNGEIDKAFHVKYNCKQALPVATNSIPTTDTMVNQKSINTFVNGDTCSDNYDLFCPRFNIEEMLNDPSRPIVNENPSQHGKESCSCDNYKAKRDMFKEELHKAMKFQNLWIDLREYICNIFSNALEMAQLSNSSQSHHSASTSTNDIRDIVLQLCKRDPHQFFMRLINQAQQFVLEAKARLFALLHDRSLNNLAEIFLIGLLDDYDALISTAIEISKLVQPLKEYLFKFNLTWDCFIQKLYQIYVYNDPVVQNNLPAFIRQLKKLLPLKGSEYQGLVHRYLSFDDEMTRISNLWLETEPWMDEYNAEQAVRITRLKQVRETWQLFTATRKLMEHSMLNKTPDVGIEMQEIHGQFSSLIAHTSDSPPLSPTTDFNSDSIAMLPSIEIVQILLDDWNKAQHQKLADITGALTAIEADAIGQDSKYNSSDHRHATHHFGQITKSIRNHSDNTDSTENGLDYEERFEFHSCNGTEITQCKSENIKKDNISLSPSISHGFSEESGDCAATQIRKKLDNLCKDNIKKKESDTPDILSKDTDLRTELEPCSCVYQHAQEIVERKKEILESPPCPCFLNSRRKWDACPCLSKSVSGTVVTNGHPKAILPASITKTNQESNKPAVKPGCTQSAQTQTRHSTTQTPNTSHNHNTHHDTLKNTGSTHRPHTHNNHIPHACYKQASVEHIKRVSCNDLSSGDGDCSDSCSSQEDSSSTTSSAQRDINKHCDCCYCEVFGHGMQSVAPVSRNYNEMRERLRQLLTKKKAKKCKTNCSPPKNPLETLPSNANSESKVIANSVLKSNAIISMMPTIQQNQRDHRDLEELLEFIEGNQGGKKENNKKTEKKARQKQRKLEEKLKKDKEETEKQKLIELQKKTPEVTITVVDPKKPVPPRLFPQCSLPEVSILPTSPPVSLPVMKQSNNKKKDKQELSNSGSNSNSSNKISNSNNKVKAANGNMKNKNINNSEKNERNTNFNQGNKNHTKNDKVECNKGNKLLANTNSICTKNNSGNNMEKLPNTDLSDKTLTKKERKKLKREMKKLEDAKVKESENLTQTESEPQIVTIKRVIESNNAEPTVTITLKGQTPAEDKVLFTLVNGQTKELSHRPEQEQNQSNNGKKKKAKPNTNNNQQQGKKLQQSNNSKQQLSQITTKTCDKNLKQQVNNEKSKISKQVDERKVQQQSINETKNSKSKKGKKNIENKENVLQQHNTVNKNKNQQNMTNKKQNKVNTPAQIPVSQKSQPNHNVPNDAVSKKIKKQQEKNTQINANKNNENANANNTNRLTKNESQKGMNKTNQATSKQHLPIEIKNTNTERVNPSLSSQFKDIGPNSKINIEDLKLPPGITITKVVGPVKQLPIRTSSLPKPVNPPKQTTIIAAPMSGIQSSYASSQAAGNVIVVDTGKLKQDLLPKANEKDSSKVSQTQSTSTKKKKKKNKNTTNSTNTTNASPMKNNDVFANDHFDEPARILHNPGTNMVTIRNPSFGPMKVPPTQQAAIIKVSENGMVTIRSPALQQAINAGLASPSKPDYIVKGDLSSSRTASDSSNLNMKHTNSITPSSLAELRSRLTSDCTSLPGLANIQISKVTSGQPIPENGINLKGTSVTLTKVRSDANIQDIRQAKTAVTEAITTSIATSTSSKNKKKKKRGSGTKQCGDDWNLVESVFTPKDIDLEDGEMDDAERELEAFKRFCLQSVPPPRKEKVNLNIKDIVLKKKSSSSSATTTVIAAN